MATAVLAREGAIRPIRMTLLSVRLLRRRVRYRSRQLAAALLRPEVGVFWVNYVRKA